MGSIPVSPLGAALSKGGGGFGGLVPMALAAQQRNAAKKTKAPGMAGATTPQPVMK